MRTLNLDDIWPETSFNSSPQRQESAAGLRLAAETPPPLEQSPQAAPPHLSVWEAAPEGPQTGPRVLAVLAGIARRLRLGLGTFDATAAIYTSLGFVAGIAAWHVVGFWAFVSGVVYNGDAGAERPAVSRPAPQVRFGSVTTTGSLATFAPSPESCVALVIDRATGLASTAACNGEAHPLRDAGRRQRENRGAGAFTRLEDTKTWAAATDLQASEAAITGSADTLQPSDVNLEIDAPH